MVIREGRTSDVTAIRRLIAQLSEDPGDAEFRNRFESLSKATDHRVLVAEENGAVVGVLHVFERPALEKPREAVVQALVVDEESRSGGVGQALMRAAEAWASERGLPSVALYTRIDRDKARAFYERIGYRLKATSHLMSRVG